MPDFFDLDGANARLPELRETLLALRTLRAELIEMRDRIVELVGPTGAGTGTREEAEQEARRLHLRIQGMVDQMEAAVAQIAAWHIELRDIPTGLVDFPALVAGRQIWLCWRLGEDRVIWWHELAEGFNARRRIEDLA